MFDPRHVLDARADSSWPEPIALFQEAFELRVNRRQLVDLCLDVLTFLKKCLDPLLDLEQMSSELSLFDTPPRGVRDCIGGG